MVLRSPILLLIIRLEMVSANVLIGLCTICCGPCQYPEKDWNVCLPQLLYCYNTTPHQATGETPFLLMFGQEPRLPVDFLLGRVPDPINGDVHEWIQEHQARLQVVHEGAKERLQLAADRRKRHHDKNVKEAPLNDGQLVFLRDLSGRGRCKIQDRWKPAVYRILKAPKGGGAVYTIAPADDPSSVKHVHRTLLKAVVMAPTPSEGPAPCGSPHGPEISSAEPEHDSSSDSDLLFLSIGAPQVNVSPSYSPVAVIPSSSELLLPPEDRTSDVPATCTVTPSAAPVPSSSLPVPTTSSDTRNIVVRRTARSTAGQHSNIHHLPRPTGEVAQGAANSISELRIHTVSAFFRPWD
ncbi:uncharacterized protein LOC112842866 [Oreochromis niloticus]|uniref:uncharacterized protein LOC112842866 n=1 Tax=Oreochromis niloticus TaxID=8128 RepID=UPI000DF14BE3|nr:uncharacterized protein LOC112842866 [Oreochromis niloticus]